MATIFGEEHFIDKTMVRFYQMQEDLIITNLEDCAKEIKFNYDIVVDKEKLRKWLTLCSRLENIEQSTLIDMATKKKFAEKDEEIEILKQALFDMALQLHKVYYSESFVFGDEVIESFETQPKEIVEAYIKYAGRKQ